MAELFPIIFVLALFVAVMIIFSRENLDYVAYSLFAALFSCVVTSYFFKTPSTDYIAFIEFRPLIFILSMQTMVLIAEKHKIFQWIAVSTLRMTKGNHRVFFYAICVISTLTASIIADVTVSIIFVPLVIRACRILKIRAAPYLFGITITINIGSIFTPFSSSENILISDAFGLDFLWFMQNFVVFVFGSLFLTLLLLDFTMLRNQPAPPEHQKIILMEIMNPNLVIINQKQFLLNSIYFGAVIVAFIFVPDAYLIALLGAILMSIFNGEKVQSSLEKVDWQVIFFFISLFLIIGCMQINGTFQYISEWLRSITSDDVLVAAIVILILTSLLSGFLANSPTAVVLITLILDIYGPNPPNAILIAFLLGINLGGNLLPQGAACDVMTLNIATKNKVEGFTYKTLLKRGGAFALFHNLLCIIYIALYVWVTGG